MFTKPPPNPGRRSAIRVLVRHRSGKSAIASWNLNGERSLGAPTHPRVTVLTWRPVICGGRLPGIWRAPARHLRKKTFGRWRIENRWRKISILLRWHKTDIFSGLGKERRTSRATSRPLDHGSTCYFGRNLHSLALPDTKRVDRGFILCRDRRCIVGWCVENRRQKNSIPLLYIGEKKSLFRFGRSS